MECDCKSLSVSCLQTEYADLESANDIGCTHCTFALHLTDVNFDNKAWLLTLFSENVNSEASIMPFRPYLGAHTFSSMSIT